MERGTATLFVIWIGNALKEIADPTYRCFHLPDPLKLTQPKIILFVWRLDNTMRWCTIQKRKINKVSQKDQPNVLSVFTEPQNLQVQKVCSMPCSPQMLQVQPTVGTGSVICVCVRGGCSARQVLHCMASGWLMSMHVRHVQGFSKPAVGLVVFLIGAGCSFVKTLMPGRQCWFASGCKPDDWGPVEFDAWGPVDLEGSSSRIIRSSPKSKSQVLEAHLFLSATHILVACVGSRKCMRWSCW